MRRVIDGFDTLAPRLDQVAEEGGAELLEARRPFRNSAKDACRQMELKNNLYISPPS
jgi:hypothetical protein